MHLKSHADVTSNAHGTIQKQLGEHWHHLHPAIQQRFEKDPVYGEHRFYRGVMGRVECSRAGIIFAHFTRIIGNPLTPYNGTNVRMDVVLHRCAGKPGVYWRRTYFYPDQPPYTVTSIKCEGVKGEMMECVGRGFGMILKLTAEEGNLHFRSVRYFWQAGRFRISLPHILAPGATHVIHEALDDNTFRFTIAMDHPCLGRTFYQTGIFKED